MYIDDKQIMHCQSGKIITESNWDISTLQGSSSLLNPPRLGKQSLERGSEQTWVHSDFENRR